MSDYYDRGDKLTRQGGYIEAIVAIIFIAAFVGLVIFLGIHISKTCANGACAASQSVTEPQSKPQTDVRCDFTGFMGEQMIAEAAKEGYRYTGRTSTLLCENALAFELKEVN